MAPKQCQAKAAGKDLTRLTPREREWEAMKPTMPFFLPGETLTAVNKVAGIVASKRNENGPTILMVGSAPRDKLDTLDVRIFTCVLAAGLVLPLSAFLVVVLVEYGLLLAHLHPNALLTLAVF